MENKTETTIFKMNAELKRKFKSKVASDGTNMTEKLTKWIEDYVKNSQ